MPYLGCRLLSPRHKTISDTRWRRRHPGKGNSYKYTKKAVIDSQKWVVLQHGAGRVAGKF